MQERPLLRGRKHDPRPRSDKKSVKLLQLPVTENGKKCFPKIRKHLSVHSNKRDATSDMSDKGCRGFHIAKANVLPGSYHAAQKYKPYKAAHIPHRKKSLPRKADTKFTTNSYKTVKHFDRKICDRCNETKNLTR